MHDKRTTTAGHWLQSAAFVACAALATVGQAAPANAGYKTVDYPGSYTARVGGINDDGTVTGVYSETSSSGPSHGYIRAKDGSFTTFDAPDGLGSTAALAISNGGAVTGVYSDSSRHDHGFIRSWNGKITEFDDPNASDTVPAAINDKGEITGSSVGSGNYLSHGFVRRADGKVKRFDGPNATNTYAYAINRDGVIVGQYTDSNGSHCFLRDSGGAITTFDIPGDNPLSCEPTGINASGEIVGSYFSTIDYMQHSFIRTPDGTITTFQVESSDTYAAAINASGAITGSYSNASGFLRTPDGQITTLNYPHADYTYGISINKKGAIAGDYYHESDGLDHAFAYRP